MVYNKLNVNTNSNKMNYLSIDNNNISIYSINLQIFFICKKKGDQLVCENYWGITLLSMA